MEKPEENSTVAFYVNATIQLCAVFAFQQLGLIWPLYIVMAMLSIVIAIQTLGAGISFSGIKLKPSTKVPSTGGINVLISVLYLVSSYHIYLIGFIGFAWIAATHSVIHLLTNIIGTSK